MTINSYRHHHKRSGKGCSECEEQHTTHEPLDEENGVMEQISDTIGSVRGIVLLGTAEVLYVVLAVALGFDRFPFNFLTLVLSIMALQFSQVIIVVQNRQGAILENKAARERDEVSRTLDMDTKAFALLADLHDKLLPGDAPERVVDVPAAVQEARKL